MDIDKKVMRQFNYKLAFKRIIVFAIFIFLGKMVWENWAQVKEASFTFRPFPLLLSTLIFAFSYFIQIWAWYLITLKLGIAISLSETLGSWFYSQLGKYLPGKVWLLLSRYYFYESKGKSKKAISVALYLETVTVIMAAGLIFLAAVALYEEARPFYSGNQFWWLSLLFVLAFISIHPRILQKILNWTLIKFKREPLSLSISYLEVLWILLICILSWVVGGIGFYLFVESVFSVSLSHILFLTGALAISSILGLVAIFAPSGLGVREGTLVYLLSFIMPVSVAVIISILTRIWMTLIEIGLIGVIYLLS
ncbi:MAG: lysylphosphatidylglycerol synthase domain-containing protein, partial [Thermodesulfobacteriota bacterium]